MLPQKEPTFLQCRCPGCKRPFDYVPIDAEACPFCKWEIQADAVWQTRQYEGLVMLPGWIRAFGWPFLLMVGGVGLFLYAYYGFHEVELKLPGAMVAIGLIFFMFKLNNNGEH
jgi:hypothetical protein